jgi:thymidylate kinase
MNFNKNYIKFDKTRNEIIRVLDILSQRKIPFIVLRGYEFLWSKTHKLYNDIDLLIPKSAISKTNEIFRELNYFSINSPGHIGYGKIKGDYKIAFDFQIEYIRQRNMPYLRYNYAAEDVSIVDGIPILTGEKLAFHLIVHSLLGRGYFLTEYKNKIYEIYESQDPNQLKSLLVKIFGHEITKRILQKIEEKKIDDLENKRLQYFIYTISNNLPLIFKFASYLRFRLFNKLKTGRVISFIGLDGSGKTTVANMLVKKLKNNGFKAEYKYMGRKKAHFFPMHKVSTIVGVSKIHKKKRPSKLYLITRELIYFLDLSMRYYLTIFPRIISGTSIVCDRYAYDFFLDKYFSPFSSFLYRFLYPRPNILIFLDVSEEEIIKRKNEYSSKIRNHYLSRLLEVKKIFHAKRVVAKGKNETLQNVYEQTLPLVLK